MLLYTGVYLSLKGVVYPNNSVIPITDIGENVTGTLLNEALQCITDKITCCKQPNRLREGEWFFPRNRGIVPPYYLSTTFYRNRGSDGTVNLNRAGKSVLEPIGRFCCEVPDATSTNVTLCVKIG